MTESDPTVLLVAWSGPTSALAARLGCAPADLLAALRTMGRDANRTPIKLNVDLANTAPLWAATRRRLASAAAGVGSESGIADHPLHLSGDV